MSGGGGGTTMCGTSSHDHLFCLPCTTCLHLEVSTSHAGTKQQHTHTPCAAVRHAACVRHLHNLYGYYYHAATAAGLERRGTNASLYGPHGDRAFVLSRAFFAGALSVLNAMPHSA